MSATWLEIVHLRAVGEEIDRIGRAVLEAVDESDGRIWVYRSADVDSDLAIHILHEGPEDLRDGSAMGARIASELGAYGMVHISRWVSVDRHQSHTKEWAENHE